MKGEPKDRIDQLVNVYQLVCKEESTTENMKPLVELYDRFNDKPTEEPLNDMISKLLEEK